MGIKIFIDAGHNDSGWNTGAVGNGLKEQDITFAVAQKLSVLLSAQGIETKLSRPTKETNLGTTNSTSITARYTMANQWGADYFISIHCNAGGGTGAETLYYKADSKAYAQTIQDVYIKETGFRDRGIKYRNDVGVIMYAKMPSVLIELGFIDTAADAARLKNEQDALAQAIAKGFYQLLNIQEADAEMVEQVTMIVNGKETRVNRILKDGRNYVELAGLGGVIATGYDAATKQVSIDHAVGAADVIIGGKPAEMPAILSKGRNYMQLAALEEHGLITTGYDASNKTVTINKA